MATEKRLIDANALKSQITRYHMSLTPRYISKLVDAEIGDVIDIIDEAPIVDAVEVVRCKECKYCVGTTASHTGRACSKGVNWRAVEPNHFCSDGERKDNDDNR